MADMILQAFWEIYSSAPTGLLFFKVVLPIHIHVSVVIPKGLLPEKKHHYATFRPLSRFMIREACFDTVFSESVCVINLYKGESSVGYLTLLSARCFTYQCYDGISARICEVPVKC